MRLIIWLILLCVPLPLAAQDQTAQLQAIITAGAGTVAVIPCGSYTVNGPLKIPQRTVVMGELPSCVHITFTGDGGGICGGTKALTQNQFAGYIQIGGSGFKLLDLDLSTTQPNAGTCFINVNDGSETSSWRISGVNIYGGSTTSTDVGIYGYAVDSGEIDHGILQYLAQMIVFADHTEANIDMHNLIIKRGTNNALLMVRQASGLNCFSSSFHDNILEGYGSTNGVSGCAQGGVIERSGFYDPSPTGGTWIQAGYTTRDNYIAGNTGVKAWNGTTDSFNNRVYASIVGASSGTYRDTKFMAGGACSVTINQSQKVISDGNTFTSAQNSYCAANGLTPAPIVMRMHDTDATAGGIRSGVTVQ